MNSKTTNCKATAAQLAAPLVQFETERRDDEFKKNRGSNSAVLFVLFTAEGAAAVFPACTTAAYPALYLTILCLNISQPDKFYNFELLAPCTRTPPAGSPLDGCPLLIILHIRIHPSYCRPFLLLQSEDAPCRGGKDRLRSGMWR